VSEPQASRGAGRPPSPAVPALSTAMLLRRGLRRRCPVCGQKRIFTRWVRMAERCPRCEFRFCREPGEWLGSWFLNICLAQVLLVVVLIVGVAVSYPRPSVVGLAVAGVLVAVGFPVLFFPYSRTLWVAIDLAMRPLELDEGVAPLWELEGDRQVLLAERAAAAAARNLPRTARDREVRPDER
jgi:uncharacterized protein (DUF983 family)